MIAAIAIERRGVPLHIFPQVSIAQNKRCGGCVVSNVFAGWAEPRSIDEQALGLHSIRDCMGRYELFFASESVDVFQQ